VVTVTGDMNANSNTLFVKNSTSRVGLNTNAPDYLLDVNGNSGFNNIYANDAATYVIGSTSYPFISLTLNNGATDSGAVYFDAGTTSFVKGSADGTQLQVGGFTSLNPSVVATTHLGTTSLPFVSVKLDNTSTDAGAIYFDAGTAKFIKSIADGTQLQLGGFTSFTPGTASLSSIGTTALPFNGVYLDNGGTDAGAVYFDAGSSKFIKLNAAGTSLSMTGYDVSMGGSLAVTGTITGTGTIIGTSVAIGFDHQTIAFTGTKLGQILMPYAMTITAVKTSVDIAPVGATSLVVDVMKKVPGLDSGRTSIFAGTPSNRPTITTGTYYAISGTPNTVGVNANDILSFDIISVGNTTAGGNHLNVTIYGVRA